MIRLRHRIRSTLQVAAFLVSFDVLAQQPVTISEKESLPPASLWEPYSHSLEVSGGIRPYRWSLVSGSLPHGLELRDDGEIQGMVDDSAAAELTLSVGDNNSPPQREQKKFTLRVETPLVTEWDRTTRVNGQRIDGSIKVSNRTGRDFDLTVIVLAVNEIGRAVAIGYQHFPLKKQTRYLQIPFGDSVSRGDYTVNVDVVGEEPISDRIFRARLVTGKQSITHGP
jgi:hypothetical protein